MGFEALERIGLTKSEIRVYLALLKLGQVSAGPLVDEAKVTRSKIYDILERLKNKGLVSHILKGEVKYYGAADPTNILEYLKQKEDEIKKNQTEIKALLPELILQQSLTEHKKIAEVFIGLKGMESAFNSLVNQFDPKETYYAFGAGAGENTKQIQLFFSRLHKKRIEKKVRSKIIFNESSKGLFESQEKSKLVEARYLIDSTPSAINIYKDMTLMAILNKEPITLLIRSKETSDSFRKYFEVMWKQAK